MPCLTHDTYSLENINLLCELHEERKDIFGLSEQVKPSRDRPSRGFSIAIVAA